MLSNKNNGYFTKKSIYSMISLSFFSILIFCLFFSLSSMNVSASEFPDAELISPESDMVYNSSILIEWSAADPQGLDLEVVLYFKEQDTDDWARISEEPLDNTGSYFWDCNNISDGHYSIQISVMNEEGRGDGDKTGIFTIDNDNSPFEISKITLFDTDNKQKEYISNNENLVLKVDIKHAEHISKSEIWADLHQLGKSMMVEPNSFDGTQAIWNISLIQCNPENGPLFIQVSVDNLETKSIKVIADNNPPKITISHPDNGFYLYSSKIVPIDNLIVFGFIDIEISVEESNKIEEINYYIDDDLTETINSSSYKFQITTPLFGFHKITVQVVDGAGFSDKSNIFGFFFIL